MIKIREKSLKVHDYFNNTDNYFGIGVNWGSIHKYKQTSFGNHMNMTARMESMTKTVKKNHNLTGNTILFSNSVFDYFKKENLFNKYNFVEVTDLSTPVSSHVEIIKSITKRVKSDFVEDINHFLP